MMNFRRAIEKHQACLATDVAGAAAERLPNEFSQAGKNHSAPVWLVGLDGQKAYVMNFHRATKKHLAA